MRKTTKPEPVHAPPKKMTVAEAKARAVDIFKCILTPYEDVIKKFIASLQEHPQVAMEWSAGAFEAAARIFVFKEVLRGLEAPPTTARSLARHALDKVLTMAENPVCSTAPTSNYASEQKLSAWAEAFKYLNDLDSSTEPDPAPHLDVCP